MPALCWRLCCLAPALDLLLLEHRLKRLLELGHLADDPLSAQYTNPKLASRAKLSKALESFGHPKLWKAMVVHSCGYGHWVPQKQRRYAVSRQWLRSLVGRAG